MKTNVHDNSIKAHREEGANIGIRAGLVLSFLRNEPNLSFTDKQIARELGYDHVSRVQPRCTELIQAGLLREVGKVKCDETNKTVRVVRYNGGAQQQSMLF